MTERRPSHSPAEEDSDFLWQSTRGSDISPCLAESESPRSERDSNRSLRRLGSQDADDSQQLDSFGLDEVGLPTPASEAHAIVGRRARWRGAEIYSVPTSGGEPAADSDSQNQAATSPIAAPVIPPLIPLVGTMLAAALAFVVMVALPGQFGSPAAAPSGPEVHVVAPPAESIPPQESPQPNLPVDSPAIPAEGNPGELAAPKEPPLPESESGPPASPSPIGPNESSVIEPKVPPTIDPPPTPPALPMPPIAAPKPIAAPAQPPAMPTEVSRLASHLAHQRLSIARQLEVAGKLEAAMKRYQTLIDENPNTNVGDEAATRLKNLRDAMK